MLRYLRLLGPIIVLAAGPAAAQQPAPQPSQEPVQETPTDTLRFRVPAITVTAQKEAADIQETPASVSAVTADTIEKSGARSVSEAAHIAPNTFFSEFTARKLSNPRVRGVGQSPNNPGVTTYIDGVPQLNANSSSQELLGIDQIEFVRGAQGTLYGRNTIGGLINITSAPPSFTKWTGSLLAPFGNYKSGDVRGTASGPLSDTLALGVGFGYSGRQGFTKNDITGHDVDSRSAVFGKVQLLWRPTANWQVRGIVTGERARDGDYALTDLGALRAKPFHTARDFEGFTRRDIAAPTLLVSRTGTQLDFSSTTGVVWWKTADLTDLDYTTFPLITRKNDERDLQFTQEFRVASANNTRLALGSAVTLRWQGGLFFFTQGYKQTAVNNFSAGVLSPLVPAPIAQTSPEAALDDKGVGLYGQGVVSFGKLDATLGLRGDYESKNARLDTFFNPAIAAPNNVSTNNSFHDVSPRVTLSYRVAPGNIVFASAARGFKAGGFNAAAPPGNEAYGEEHSWNYEGGVKTTWFARRLTLNATVFSIDWSNLQVNEPNPFVPAQFFIANAAKATSRGVEVELVARPLANLDVFGGFGTANARFGSGSQSSGVDVSGRRLANAPRYTADFGVQYSHAVAAAASIYGRADAVSYGAFQFDDANTAGQDAYVLANFRAGVRRDRVFIEGWVRNAFDTHYVLTAFVYSPLLAPSGFIGENGPARTFGVRAGVGF